MYTELHRHLDVSLRSETLLELAQAKGLEPQNLSLDDFKKKLIIQRPMADLSTVLSQFGLFQKVLDNSAILQRVASEVIEDCWNEGIHQIELRYSPHFISQYSKLSWEESLMAFYQGMLIGLNRFPQMKAGLICITSRDAGPEIVDRGVEFYLKHKKYFIGIDLAGSEIQYPCRWFENSFKKVIQQGGQITIHAGEALGPESVWEAIELLGAQRIGHGIASIQDPLLVNYLADHQICLEICPTSNWLTGAVRSLKEHPLAKLLRAGVPVCINTDDPGIFGVSLNHEIQVCRDQMGLTETELALCQKYALQASFLNDQSHQQH